MSDDSDGPNESSQSTLDGQGQSCLGDFDDSSDNGETTSDGE